MEKYEWGEFEGFELLEDSDGDVYKVEDIELLRQKLIEDFKKSWIFHEGHMTAEDFIDIINKRFGVE